MAEEILVFDAAGSNVDGSNPGTSFAIGPGTSYPLVEASFPAAPLNVLYSSSVDTEGEDPVTGRHGNRTISLRIGVDESGAVHTLTDALRGKFAKLQAEGGTLKRTLKDGSVRIYDILAGDGWEVPYTDQYLLAHSADIPVSFPALPYSRGTEVDMGDNVETTLPMLTFSETGVLGEVPALGRLVVDNDVAFDQAWLIWGWETDQYYTHTTSSGSGGLFYEAESRTPMGGAATAVGPAGASGAGSNVVRQSALTTVYQALLSTQSSGGTHLTHRGSFRVYAQIQVAPANTGNVSIALSWAAGDFSYPTTNTAVTITEPIWVSYAAWRLVDLGVVTIPTTATQWEGRVIAKSTVAGDDIDIDYLMIVPTDGGFGRLRSSPTRQTPTTFSARDEFDQTAGVLAGKTLPVGGTWSGAGSATDFSVVTGTHTANRTAVSDAAGAADSGRFAIAGSTNYTNTIVQVDQKFSADSPQWGVIARYVDINNWLVAQVTPGSVNSFLAVNKQVAGVTTQITNIIYPGSYTLQAANVNATVRLVVDDQGRFYVWWNNESEPRLLGQDAELALGGPLATGKPGFFDYHANPGASTRTFDNFIVAVPTTEPAMFASQSAEIRHNLARRENSAGTFWVERAISGDYIRIPPARAEGRGLRFAVAAARNDPSIMPNPSIDAISARLFVTPRYLT